MSEKHQDLRKSLKRTGTAAAAALAITSLVSMLGMSAHATENCDKGNNGWGNGEDGQNRGSFQGGGVSQGGPGGGTAQSDSKPDGGGR